MCETGRSRYITSVISTVRYASGRETAEMGSYDVTRGVFALSRFLGGVSFQLAARLRLEDDIVFDLPERLFVRAKIPPVREEWGLGSEDLASSSPPCLELKRWNTSIPVLALVAKVLPGRGRSRARH